MPTALGPLVLNVPMELATHLQGHMDSAGRVSLEVKPAAQAVLANLHDHLECIRMPHAKFRADLFKTVATHKEQKNRHTHRFSYTYKIFQSKIMIE